MLYHYGLQVGFKALFSGNFSREVLKSIIVPQNYWRTLEFRLVFNELQATATDKILDVGSPKLLSLYLADKVGAQVFSTDIEKYFIHDFQKFQRQQAIPDDRFHPMIADGRNLPFPDNHFSMAYSISVLEHIPLEGDSVCAKELGRVLRPGGRCVVTVPFSPSSRIEYKQPSEFYWSGSSQADSTSKGVFFQRRYSEKDLMERVVGPSCLRLEKLLFMGERIKFSEGKELAHFLHPLLGPIQPALSALFHVSPSPDWRSMKQPLGALLVMSKGYSSPTSGKT